MTLLYYSTYHLLLRLELDTFGVVGLAYQRNHRTTQGYLVSSCLTGELILAVPLTHRNLTRTMKNIVNTYRLTREDRSYLVVPLFHVHGLLAGFLAPLHSGGTVIIPSKFSAKAFWPDFIKFKATWYTAGIDLISPPRSHSTNNSLTSVPFLAIFY